MRHVLLALALVALTLPFAAAPVLASCTDAKLTAYSMANEGMTGGEAPLVTCYNSPRPNLSNVDYDPQGNNTCPGVAIPAFSWNDCISSYVVVINNCHVGIRIYFDANYSQTMYTHWGSYTRDTMPQGINDAASSIGFLWRATCPLSPEP